MHPKHIALSLCLLCLLGITYAMGEANPPQKAISKTEAIRRLLRQESTQRVAKLGQELRSLARLVRKQSKNIASLQATIRRLRGLQRLKRKVERHEQKLTQHASILLANKRRSQRNAQRSQNNQKRRLICRAVPGRPKKRRATAACNSLGRGWSLVGGGFYTRAPGRIRFSMSHDKKCVGKKGCFRSHLLKKWSCQAGGKRKHQCWAVCCKLQ